MTVWFFLDKRKFIPDSFCADAWWVHLCSIEFRLLTDLKDVPAHRELQKMNFLLPSSRISCASWLLQYEKILPPRLRPLPSHEAVLSGYLFFSAGKQGLYVWPPLQLPLFYWQLLQPRILRRLPRASFICHEWRVTVSSIYTTNTIAISNWRGIVTPTLGIPN